MQINSVSTSVPVTYTKPAATPKGTSPAGDQVSMSTSATSFSSLVSQVGEMPEVRGEVVDAYKARIQAGYPAQQDLDGLVNLMGGTWAKGASSADSAE
jgi:hypothetical protein